MPAITNATPLQTSRTAREQGSAAGSAQHRVDVGAVITADTRGSGGVAGDITGSAATEGLRCVDAAEMLQRLAAPTITGAASASNAYSIAAEVRLDMAVDMQAQAEAAARIVGDVVNNQGAVDLPCEDSQHPVAGEPIAATAPSKGQAPVHQGT
jgi:hypothetical protein